MSNPEPARRGSSQQGLTRWLTTAVVTAGCAIALGGYFANASASAAGHRNSLAPDALNVQRRLVALRYLPADALTGRWDYQTSQAILAFQGWEGLSRDGTVGARTWAALSSASPPTPRPAGAGRVIEVFRQQGVTLLVDGSHLIRAVHSSSGKPGFQTPAGTFRVSVKVRNSWSVPYHVWLPYASYFNGGIAFHGSSDVPAYAASHGCIRIPTPEAALVYSFASVGTRVVVY